MKKAKGKFSKFLVDFVVLTNVCSMSPRGGRGPHAQNPDVQLGTQKMIKTEERRIRIAVELPESIHKMLMKLCAHYRTNNISHAVRLTIEDRLKETETEDGGRRSEMGVEL